MLGRWASWNGTPTVVPLRLERRTWRGRHTVDDRCAVGSCRRMAPCWRSWPGRTEEPRNCTFAASISSPATPLNGTEGASSPFFSPDAQWVGFFADSKLKKVPVTGGAVVTLAEAPDNRGGSWAEDGTIVFAPSNRVGLMRVSSVGGQTQQITTLEAGEITHRFPQILPGDAAVLYTASTEMNIGDDAKLVVQPLPSGERIIVERGGYFGRYVASGHIAYIQDDTLFAIALRPPAVGGDRSCGAYDGCRPIECGQGQCAVCRVADGRVGLSPGAEHLRRTADGVVGPHRVDRLASRRPSRVEEP